MHCNCCHNDMLRSEFNKSQLKKIAAKRVCKNCSLEKNVSVDSVRVLVDWLLYNGAKFPSLVITEHSAVYRSVVASKRVNRNSNILEIPRKCIITSDDAKKSTIGHDVDKSDFTPKDNHTWLALYLLQERESGCSFFKPYIDSIPKHYRNFPAYYNKDEILQMQVSFSVDMLKQRQYVLEKEYNSFVSALPKYTKYALSDFIWAKTAVLTRVFGFKSRDENSKEGLVPMADMLNHKDDPGTHWQFELERDAFTIKTTKMVLTGGEIFDTYGQKCNSRYLINYGFVLNNNEKNNQAVVFINPQTMVTGSDEFKNIKCGIVGKPTSYDDNYSGYRLNIIHKLETKVSVDGNIRFQFGILNKNTSENVLVGMCLTVIRILLSTEDEIKNLCEVRNKHKPISVENELSVLKCLSNICLDRLSQFTSDLQTDIARRDSFEPMSNSYNIITLLISEKEVLQWYVDLEMFVISSWDKHHNVYKVNKDIRRNEKFNIYGSIHWSELLN